MDHAIAHIEELALSGIPEEQKRWYAVKLFERDEKATEHLNLSASVKSGVEEAVKACEKELDDDAESIITNERYVYIAQLLKGIYKKKGKGELSTSDKIDKIITNRWLALPIFAVIMWLVYALSMGKSITDGGISIPSLIRQRDQLFVAQRALPVVGHDPVRVQDDGLGQDGGGVQQLAQAPCFCYYAFFSS